VAERDRASPDGERLYACDYARRHVLTMERDGTGPAVFCESPRGAADGLAVDVEGGVWIALGDGGGVARFTPGGELDVVVDVPADFVLALSGYEQDDTLFKLAGVQLRGDCHAPLLDERTTQSSVPNLYIIGTAVGGTQDKYTVFIENCHVHIPRVLAAITGTPMPATVAADAPIGPPET